MTQPVTSITGARAAADGSAVDFSGAPFNLEKITSGQSAALRPKTLSAVRTTVRIAMGADSIAMKPEEVKALAISFLPEAQRKVDTTFAKYIKSAPKLQLKFWTPEELKAAGKRNADSLFAYVDSAAPSIVNVSHQSVIFKKFNVDVSDTKTLLLHEVLHTRSAAFALNMAQTYGAPLADGKAASFSDGSPVRGITEGLTEIFTMEALNVTQTPASYGRETKWAERLIGKVGIETATKAYFGNDVVSMVLVKKAIKELVDADKAAPESASARGAPQGRLHLTCGGCC